MEKKPTIDVSTYSKPAYLPGFVEEFMRPRVWESSARYGGGCQKVRHAAARQ
jgi:hypothetical protein